MAGDAGDLDQAIWPRPQTLVNVAIVREGQTDVVYVECMVY